MKGYNKYIILLFIFSMFLCSCNNGNKACFENDCLIFNGEKYIETSGKYELNDKLCKTSDGWTIYGIAGDDEHNYLEVSSFYDNHLYVRETFTYDNSKIVEVGIGNFPNNYSNDEKLIGIVNGLLERKKIQISDHNIIAQYDPEWICICVKYENDVVGHEIGYLMTYNGEKVFYNCSENSITEVSDEELGYIGGN